MKKVIALLLLISLLLSGCNSGNGDLMKDVKPSDQRDGLITLEEYEEGPFTGTVWDNALVADFGIRLFRNRHKLSVLPEGR